jgi:palmitoyltransferase
MSINTATPLFSFARLETLGDAIVVAVNYGGLSIFGVGLLAASTASLPTGLLLYHLYLIWAGMTTNESAKWTEWKEDMEDGYVFKAKKQHLREHNLARGMNAQASQVGINGNPALSVPDRDYYETRGRDTTDYVLVRTNDGKPPRGQEQLWDRVWSLRDIDNIYDLGVVENFLEVLRGR